MKLLLSEAIGVELRDVEENLNALEKFLEELPEKALSLGVRVIIAAILFFVGSRLIKVLRRILKKSLTKAGVEIGVMQFLDGFLKISLYFVLILMVAGNFGFDATSIVALLGSAGVAIGLAVQGSLSNLAGGVLILLLKPFRVGDYIIEDSNKNEGTVKEIGIFYTKLKTPDNRTIVLPNGALSNTSLTNVTDQSTRRIDLSFGISYDADIAGAKSVVYDVAYRNENVLKGEGITVFVDSLGASEVVIGLKCFVETDKYWATRWKLVEDVKLSLDAAGIEIPYQNVSVHMVEK